MMSKAKEILKTVNEEQNAKYNLKGRYFNADEKKQLFALLYKLEDHFERLGKTDLEILIGKVIRELNDNGIM